MDIEGDGVVQEVHDASVEDGEVHRKRDGGKHRQFKHQHWKYLLISKTILYKYNYLINIINLKIVKNANKEEM